MEEQTFQQTDEFEEEPQQDDVVISLTLTGGRDCIMDLLEQMNAVKGFSVLEGSFTVNVGEPPLL